MLGVSRMVAQSRMSFVWLQEGDPVGSSLGRKSNLLRALANICYRSVNAMKRRSCAWIATLIYHIPLHLQVSSSTRPSPRSGWRATGIESLWLRLRISVSSGVGVVCCP